MADVAGARRARGLSLQAELTGTAPPPPETLFASSVSDYLYAEIWSRPGLDRRSRFLIALAGAACEGEVGFLDAYARGALASGALSLPELREAALHLAVYAGWGKGARLDGAATRAAAELGLPAAPLRRLVDHPDGEVRRAGGARTFEEVMTFPAPPPVTPYYAAGILDFVFGELWQRPELDRRGRRWVTLVGVADSSARIPIRTHLYAALATGDASEAELGEFVLQYAVHGGWPRASALQAEALDVARLVREGKPYAD